MDLPRKSLLSAMLVGALFGAPGLASGQAPGAPGAPGGAGHPPIIQLATLPRRARVPRRIRVSRLRLNLWRRGLRLRGSRAICDLYENVRTRQPPHDSYARGPPGRP